MNRLSQLRKLLSMPPGKSLAKVRAKVREARDDRKEAKHHQHHATYRADGGHDQAAIARLIKAFDVDLLMPHRETITALSDRVMTHEFDLLGSGWTGVSNTSGLEVTKANLPEATRITKLLPDSYKPIDWHVDFKSNHRWDPRGWYRHQPQVVGNGIDVKVPWELSRMQHLPLLAWGFVLSNAGHDMPCSADQYRDEFRCQVMDFIAHNPPRFGINWNCTMDVAIRGAGWALTFDLFRATGAEFDDAFTQVFTRSLHEHADHIAANLEWDENIRGNHYLADVAGLLVLSAYLPADETTDRYMRFAARELIAETLRQFHPDGSNFEASTSYHRLSAEMVLYGLAVLQAVTPARIDALTHDGWPALRPGDASPILSLRKTATDAATVIPEGVIHRMARMGRFTQDILDRYDRDPQIGDNDNGRFFKLMPVAHRDTDGHLYEDPRNHRHLVNAVDGLFEKKGTVPISLGALPFETSVIRSLIGDARFEHPDLPAFTDHIAYPGMGLYLYKHGRMTTIVRCGEIGQNGHGGHAHDDQMSFVLYVDGEPVVIDPGTGCYTSNVAVRNAFRSAWMHNTSLIYETGSLIWDDGISGLFSATSTAEPCILTRTNNQFQCVSRRVRGDTRTFVFKSDRLEISDDIAVVPEPAVLPIHLAPETEFQADFEEESVEITLNNGIRLCINQSNSGWCCFSKINPDERQQLAMQSNSYGHWEENPQVIHLIHDTPTNSALTWSISLAEESP